MKYHPDIELLLQYSSGQLAPSLAVAIGLHQQQCKFCQQQIDELESVGGDTIESLPSQPINDESIILKDFNSLLNDIDSLPETNSSSEYDGLAVAQHDIPLVDTLSKQEFDQLPWQRIGLKMWKATIPMDDPGYELEILKFSPFAKIPQHTHDGNEFTLVLQGDFHDHQDSYCEGEFITQNHSHEHQPKAGRNGCICLAVTDAPLKFTGTLGPLLNWFTR